MEVRVDNQRCSEGIADIYIRKQGAFAPCSNRVRVSLKIRYFLPRSRKEGNKSIYGNI